MNSTRAVLICLLPLAACASTGPRLSGDSFPERARQLLIEQAENGPVALVSELDQPDAATLAFAAEDGVRGMEVTFDPRLPVNSRFRLVVTQMGGNPCAHDGLISERYTIAFCRGEDAVALADADSSEPAAETVRRAARQIFPDEYERRGSGFGLFGNIGSGVSIGVGTGVSIGF